MREGFFGDRGLYYRVGELDDRPTLLFLHGLSGSASVWFPYEQEFEPRYNILSIDLRGHGSSWRWPRYEDYGLDLFAEDVSLLLHYLGIQRYVLVGHSFGTLVALHLMLRETGAERVVLISPNYAVHRMLRSRATRPVLSLFGAAVSRLPSIRWRGDHLDYSSLGFTADWDWRRLRADIYNTGIRTYLHCLQHVYSFNRDDDWGRIRVPTLVVHGKKDSFIPLSHAKELAARLPRGELRIMEEGNHMLVLNDRPTLLRTINDFFGA